MYLYMAEADDFTPNPIGDKYAALATSFLEAHKGQVVGNEMIGYLGNLIANTPCEIAGLAEAASTLGVSRQRVAQLAPKMPPLVGRVAATPLWLKEQVEDFRLRRQAQDAKSRHKY